MTRGNQSCHSALVRGECGPRDLEPELTNVCLLSVWEDEPVGHADGGPIWYVREAFIKLNLP